MPNPFDQFDAGPQAPPGGPGAPQAPGPGANPFDALDAPQAAHAPPPPPPPRPPRRDMGILDKTLGILGLGRYPTPEETGPALNVGLGLAEQAASMGTQAVLTPVAGAAGVVQALNPFAEEGAGAEAVRAVRGLAYQPGERGQQVASSALERVAGALPEPVLRVGQEASQALAESPDWYAREMGPVAGAVAAAAPTAVLEALPAGSALRKARQAGVAAEQAARATGRGAPPLRTPADSPAAPPASDYQRIKELWREGKEAPIAAELQPDPEIVAAAGRLEVEPISSAVSRNKAYIDAEQALKSRPGSSLRGIEDKSIADLGERADALIRDMGGQTERNVLQARVKGEMMTVIDDMETRADELYARVREGVAAGELTDPGTTRGYILGQLEDLGGDPTLLTSAEKKLLMLTTEVGPDGARVPRQPTYAALDRVRRDIGAALGRKNTGPFKDDDVGTLKQLYRQLSEDQQLHADDAGVGEIYRAGRELVAQRKEVEDAAKVLFGKQVSDSLVPKLSQAVGAFTKQDAEKLNKLFQAVPHHLRSEVAATALGDLFTHAMRKTDASIGQGFVGAYKLLQKNPRLRFELFKYLPQEAWQRFDDIGKVATGIYRSKALENTSRTARDVIAAAEDGGLFTKIYQGARVLGPAEYLASQMGVPTGFTTAIGGTVYALAQAGKRPLVEKADDLVTSASFRMAVERYARGDVEGAQSTLGRSQAFRDWLTAQPPDIRKEVKALGLIPWLTQGSSRESEPQQ